MHNYLPFTTLGFPFEELGCLKCLILWLCGKCADSYRHLPWGCLSSLQILGTVLVWKTAINPANASSAQCSVQTQEIFGFLFKIRRSDAMEMLIRKRKIWLHSQTSPQTNLSPHFAIFLPSGPWILKFYKFIIVILICSRESSFHDQFPPPGSFFCSSSHITEFLCNN